MSMESQQGFAAMRKQTLTLANLERHEHIEPESLDHGALFGGDALGLWGPAAEQEKKEVRGENCARCRGTGNPPEARGAARAGGVAVLRSPDEYDSEEEDDENEREEGRGGGIE
eukprot:gene1524-10696_t